MRSSLSSAFELGLGTEQGRQKKKKEETVNNLLNQYKVHPGEDSKHILEWFFFLSKSNKQMLLINLRKSSFS